MSGLFYGEHGLDNEGLCAHILLYMAQSLVFQDGLSYLQLLGHGRRKRQSLRGTERL